MSAVTTSPARSNAPGSPPRQTGSHLPLALPGGKARHLAIPRRRSLKAGTPAAITAEAADQPGHRQDELAARLSGPGSP
ncbi:MAG: hypothetical protein KatS3mg064_1029 [Tepidiforma sp.]|nr:MAG: hypothetical protein KatS3mg064_1029 [Tepidiforma sp.]